MARLNLKKVDEYYKKKFLIDSTINNQVVKDKNIIYGQKAINYKLPEHLDRNTEDYDIYSRNPRKSARLLERELDKQFGGDFFRIKKAKYDRTVKVVSNINENTVADFTKPDRKIPFETSPDNIRYARLNFLKMKLKKILKQKDMEFRHKKDRDMINRINTYKKYYRDIWEE